MGLDLVLECSGGQAVSPTCLLLVKSLLKAQPASVSFRSGSQWTGHPTGSKSKGSAYALLFFFFFLELWPQWLLQGLAYCRCFMHI